MADVSKEYSIFFRVLFTFLLTIKILGAIIKKIKTHRNQRGMNMNETLKNWNGDIFVNGERVDNKFNFDALKGSVTIRLTPGAESFTRQFHQEPEEPVSIDLSDIKGLYKITVKRYMTRKSTPDFDFMAKWNNDIPMPLMTMVGTVEKQTPGMLYMKLHGDITESVTQNCLCCGKPITNPVSKYFGMGPVCGQHNYVNPFGSTEELKNAVADYRKKLQNITWEGWVIRSAIVEGILL